MPFYRQYFLDITDHIRGMKEFNAPDDATAMQAADNFARGAAYEIWNLDRLVARKNIKRYTRGDDPQGSKRTWSVS